MHRGAGRQTRDQLVRPVGGWLADLYGPKLETLVELDRMGWKSAENLLAGIQASKSRGLERLLAALSIRHVGTRVATVLAQQFGSLEKLQAADVATLSEVNEIGPVIARSVYEFLHHENGRRVIEHLAAAGVKMEAATAPAVAADVVSSGALAGKTLVVTGTLTKYTRDEIERLIAEHGGRAASSVSAKTDYLVAGEKAGSKLEKAQKLGVAVLSEEAFEKLLRNAESGTRNTE